MSVKQITIGAVTYSAGHATAVEQDELMSLLSGALIERGVAMARAGEELGDEVLVPMFMSMNQTTKKRVSEILMRPVSLDGTRKVELKDFQNRLVEYNKLLAELLRWNLSDFFDYLRDVLSAAQQSSHRTEEL